MKLRSLLYVPADNAKFVSKAASRAADAVILDLEASVPAAAKSAARDGLVEAVGQAASAGAVVVVRINAGDIDDARAAASAGAALLMVPKVHGERDISELNHALTGIEAETGCAPVGLIAMIESPDAVLDARLIARAPRMRGLVVGDEGLAAAMNATADPDVLRAPKLLVHYAAKARGLLSFGLLGSAADAADLPAIAAAAQEARRFGFDGATCVNPAAVPLLNRGFAPRRDEIEWARRMLGADGSRAASRTDGSLSDDAALARARRILDDAR